MEQQTLFKVRDKRNKGWFWVENDYFNGFGKILGAKAIAVYVSLCRHADNEQKCFPAQKTIAEETKLGERTVRNIIRELEKYKIIETTKERNSRGQWLNNVYWLLDKSEWIYPPEATSADGKPEAKNDISRGKKRHIQRQPVPLNNTNRNNTNNNIILHTKQSFDDLNSLIYLFKNVNPSYKQLFKRKTERNALERLIKEHGVDKITKIIKILPKSNQIKYAPIITTPIQLENKLGVLLAFFKQESGKSRKIKL